MWEEIFKFINDHYPVLGGALVLVVGTFYLAGKYFHWTHRVEKTEEDCKKIEGRMYPKLNDISTSIITLNTSFKGLVIHLQAKDITFDAKLFMSNSPIKLTKLGVEILQVIAGDTYVDNNVSALISEMDAQGVKTALDSQIIAPIVISRVSENDNFKHIKDYIFNNPIYNTVDESGAPVSLSLSIKVIAQVMGVYLRDKYLSKHPELNPEAIPSGLTHS